MSPRKYITTYNKHPLKVKNALVNKYNIIY